MGPTKRAEWQPKKESTCSLSRGCWRGEIVEDDDYKVRRTTVQPVTATLNTEEPFAWAHYYSFHSNQLDGGGAGNRRSKRYYRWSQQDFRPYPDPHAIKTRFAINLWLEKMNKADFCINQQYSTFGLKKYRSKKSHACLWIFQECLGLL